MFRKVSRFFIFVPVALIGWFAPADAFSENSSGVLLTAYNNFGYNAAPPLPYESGVQSVGSVVVDNINQNFDQNPVFGLYEDFIIEYDGYLTLDTDAEVILYAPADDGVLFFIDDVLIINDWVDKGGGGSFSQPVNFVAGESKKIKLWFYENGGGAWVQLYWDRGFGFEVIEPAFFNQVPATTTTTTVPFINAPGNIRAEDVSFDSLRLLWDVPESNVGVDGFDVTYYCDSILNKTNIFTADNFLVIDGLQEQSECFFTVVAFNSLISSPISDIFTIITAVKPTTTTTTELNVIEEQVDLPVVETTIPKVATTTTTSTIASTTTSITPTTTTVPTVNEEQVIEFQEQLTVPDENASTEEKQAFEAEVNIFSGEYDNYVPSGSTITVAQRRAVVAATAVIFLLPAPVPVSSSPKTRK